MHPGRAARGANARREPKALRRESEFADAICDRLVHNAHLVTLRGGSMRKKKAIAPEVTENKN